MRKTLMAALAGTALTVALPQTAWAQAAPQKPHIVVIWGDDIGTWNISHNSRGMMGYTDAEHRPHRPRRRVVHRLLRPAELHGGARRLHQRLVPVRSGMTKVGLPGAKEGWQKTDVTMATVLKSQGYATGQFGKNHQGDRDEHLPTMHGFDEFFGSLYHLNAEEEPENLDYPKDPEFRKKFGPRGVLKTKADGKGGQTIENTGPLTKKRMETIDEETLAAAKDFIERNVKAGKPFFCWWNATRMHFRTHVKAEHRGKSGQDEYSDGMVEHDGQVGELLEADRRPRHRQQHDRACTRPTTARTTIPGPMPAPRRSAARRTRTGKAPTASRPSCAGPASSRPASTLNGIVAHEDWLPTFAAAAGDAGHQGEAAARASTSTAGTYTNYIDGYNMLDYLERQGQGVAAQRILVCQRRRPDRRGALAGLEGRLPGEPRRGVRRVARAVHRAARAAAVQPAARSVREGAAQLEHLQRLVPRSPLRDRADPGAGRPLPA